MSDKNLIALLAISLLICAIFSSCSPTAEPAADASVSTRSTPSSEVTVDSISMSIDDLTAIVHDSIPAANITDIVECRNCMTTEDFTQTGCFYSISNSISSFDLYIAFDSVLCNRLQSINNENEIGEVGYLVLCDNSQSPSYYFDCATNNLFYTSSQTREDRGTWVFYNVWVYKNEEINSEYLSIIHDAEMEHSQTLTDIANAEYSVSGWITDYDLEFNYLLLSGTASRADKTDDYSGNMRLNFDAADIGTLGSLSVGKKIDMNGFSETDEEGASDGYWFDYRQFNSENESALGLKRQKIEEMKASLAYYRELITNEVEIEDVSDTITLPEASDIATQYINLLKEKEDYDSVDFASYSLYDIDGNGTDELIILSGTCEADAVFQVYTYADGHSMLIGDFFGGHCRLCGKSDDVGLTIHYAHMGYEEAHEVNIDNEGLNITEILASRETEDYTEFDYCIPLDSWAIDDMDPLMKMQ